jgi:hypothetical protein
LGGFAVANDFAANSTTRAKGVCSSQNGGMGGKIHLSSVRSSIDYEMNFWLGLKSGIFFGKRENFRIVVSSQISELSTVVSINLYDQSLRTEDGRHGKYAD